MSIYVFFVDVASAGKIHLSRVGPSLSFRYACRGVKIDATLAVVCFLSFSLPLNPICPSLSLGIFISPHASVFLSLSVSLSLYLSLFVLQLRCILHLVAL